MSVALQAQSVARLAARAKGAMCKMALLPLNRPPVAIGSAEDFAELVRDATASVLVDFWGGLVRSVPDGRRHV